MKTEKYRMAHTAGSHSSFVRDRDVVVEWYDHGRGALYEFAMMVIFDPAAQASLARVLTLPAASTPDGIAANLAERFKSYWDVEKFAAEHAIAFRVERDLSV